MSDTILYAQKFELTILRFACGVGVVRMCTELYRDITVAYYPTDFAIDIALLAVLAVPLMLSFSALKLNYYLIPLCSLILVLLPLTWISSGGLASNNEYQIIGAIFFFSAILNGRWLVFFVSAAILVEIAVLYVWHNHISCVSALLKEPSMQSDHFMMMAVAVTVIVVFLKHRICAKRQLLDDQRDILSLKLEELAQQTTRIKEQKKELEKINKQLELKVEERSEELSKRNESLRSYMNMSLKQINAPLHSILDSVAEITRLDQNHEIVKLLTDSGIELERSVKAMADRLNQDNDKLNMKGL